MNIEIAFASMAKMVAIITGLLTTILIARVFGLAWVGAYVTITSAAMVAAALTRLGMDNIIVKTFSLSSDNKTRQEHVSNIFMYSLLILVFACGIFLGGLCINENLIEVNYFLALIVIPFQANIFFCASLLRGMNFLTLSVAITEAFPSVVRLLSFLIMYKFEFAPTSLAFATIILLSNLISIVIIVLVLIKNSVFNFRFGNYNLFKRTVIDSSVYLQLALFNQSTNGLDTLIVSLILSDKAVGVYGIIQRLGMVLISLNTTVSSSILPGLFRHFKNNDSKKFRKAYLDGVVFSFIIGSSYLAAFFVLGDWIFSLWMLDQNYKKSLLFNIIGIYFRLYGAFCNVAR